MREKQTILVVDDTKENILILIGLLGEQYNVMAAKSGKAALEIISEEDVDLVLLDIMMPGMDGYEVCKVLKSEQETRDIPILFITAKSDEESIEKAYDIGGVDYVTKPFKPRELMARIATHLQLSETLKTLEYLAHRDPLTGIYNRRSFFELGEQLFHRSEKLFAIMIDIDKFKHINDKFGHSAGDLVIKNCTHTISHMIDSETIFGRIGGEEFIVLLEAYSIDEAQTQAEEIRMGIENLKSIHGAYEVRATISNGIAQKRSSDDIYSLVNRADKALYEAKRLGRNRVYFIA